MSRVMVNAVDEGLSFPALSVAFAVMELLPCDSS